jgi:hypothetical protein
MRKRVKVGAIATSSIALGLLGFYLLVIKPKRENEDKYNYYQIELMKSHRQTYGTNPEGWSAAGIDEHYKITKQMVCLDRYMAGNHPFPQAVTACKQEAIIP